MASSGVSLRSVALSTLPAITAAWTLLQETSNGPTSRAGALLALWNETLYVFGGRANDARLPHDPKTYEITKVNGSFQFATYDGKHVKTCEGNVSYHDCYDIDVDRQLNDLWAYPIRCASGGCSGALDGWTRVDAGAEMGGCRLVDGLDVCSHPCERVNHGGGVFPDGTLFTYGGVGQMCEDYCSDVWTFDLPACAADPSACVWRDHGPGDREDDRLDALEALLPEAGATPRPPGPGKRWRMAHAQPSAEDTAALFGSSVVGGNGNALTLPRWEWVMFGGHRLWHGFAGANSLANDWNDTSKLPFGGYLDDLWTAKWYPSGGTGGARGAVVWRQLRPRESCFAHVGPTWESRNELACAVLWPPARASAALTVHGASLFLHGGFTATYPYPHVLGRGAQAGTSPIAADALTAYPTQPHYLSDLWRYDVPTGLWAELKPVGARPGARRGHSLTSLGLGSGALMLVGGSTGNELLGETWVLNITTPAPRWGLRRTHVHPMLPPNCTSDVLAEGASLEGATAETLSAFLPPELLNGTADPQLNAAYGRSVAVGGPFLLQTPMGSVITLGYSVAGEPTRRIGTLPPLTIPQPRRRAPGWDGCRNRVDGRADLPQELQWAYPGQRADHGAVFSHTAQTLLLLGGEVLPRRQEPHSSGRVTHATVVDPRGELWGWNAQACPGECSARGDCVYGDCVCRPGWYGVDCSNATCPGDFVRYDDVSHAAYRTPCCSAAVYVPPTEDLSPEEMERRAATAASALDYWSNPWRAGYESRYPYDDAAGLQKVVCSDRVRHRSRGTCNGFGTCQCIPPFVGPDCSILDCPRNCSGRGACALEFPVARCLCEPPYAGHDCGIQTCLNNCSWPNGACNTTTGQCTCGWARNPYNRSQLYRPFEGPDCSYLTPFAAAGRSSASNVLWAAVAAAAVILLAGGGHAAWERDRER